MRLRLICLAVPLFLSSQLYSQEFISKFCEDDAHKAFQKVFSAPQYRVLKNITYTKQIGKRLNNPPIGELDIMVLDGANLIVVVEVKYARGVKNRIKAKKKAIFQMRRFSLNCLRKKCDFWDGIRKLKVEVDPKKVKIGLLSYQGQDGEDLHYEDLQSVASLQLLPPPH